MEFDQKTNRYSMGLTLGLIGIVIAVIMGFVCGLIGGGIGLILGSIAVCLGLRTPKKESGAIFTGIMAIIMSFGVTMASVNFMTYLYDKACESEQTMIMREHGKNPYFGIVGLIWDSTRDGHEISSLKEELVILNEWQMR